MKNTTASLKKPEIHCSKNYCRRCRIGRVAGRGTRHAAPSRPGCASRLAPGDARAEGAQLGQTAEAEAPSLNTICVHLQLSHHSPQVRALRGVCGVTGQQTPSGLLSLYFRGVSQIYYIISYGARTAPARRRAQTMSQSPERHHTTSTDLHRHRPQFCRPHHIPTDLHRHRPQFCRLQ